MVHVLPVFGTLWYLHSWHPDWLGGFPAAIVDLSTFALAFLGGYLAVNPPKDTQAAQRRFYITSFVVLAVLGFGANIWQRNIEKSKQDQFTAAQVAKDQRFSEDLKGVQKSSDSILSFVANPPKGVTRDQLASFVESLIANRTESRREGGSSHLDQLSNERLSDVTKTTVKQLQGLAMEWKDGDHNDYLIAYEQLLQPASTDPRRD